MFILLFPLLGMAQPLTYDALVNRYIIQYQEIAVKEMMQYRIPASITLAQGIFESCAGTSSLATVANNHFGIKCHKEWQGKTYIHDDETKNECFRKYDNAEESFRDHSVFLAQRERYKVLFENDITDYKAWAKGLKEAGYATNPEYARKLIESIEKYQLYRFDVADFSVAFADSLRKKGDTIVPVKSIPAYDVFAIGPGNRPVYINNGLQFILLSKQDNIKSVAKAFDVTESKILKWNDMKKGAKLVPGQMVYLESKRRKGVAPTHIVKAGETMYTISQQAGIMLKMLYKKNNMEPGHRITTGQKLLLR